MTEKILIVDDDANTLASYERQLRKKLSVEIAEGGEKALEIIKDKGPFAVVVSDMRMPGMDGIQLFAKVKERYPDTVRMMITGFAELQIAIDAVNKGNIFRFLSKPCHVKIFFNTLMDGIEQYRLIIAERELLNKTLNGSISVLTEILGIVNPAAFSRVHSIRRYVNQIVTHLKLPNSWQFEIAGLLLQIGCVILPTEIINKINSGQTITDDEFKMFCSHPMAGRKLLEKIPRLEKVARMIEGQRRPFRNYPPQPEDVTKVDPVALGSQILKVAHNYDLLMSENVLSEEEALLTLHKRRGEYNLRLLEVIESSMVLGTSGKQDIVKRIVSSELTEGMILDEDVFTIPGMLLLKKGSEITELNLIRLHNYDQRDGIQEPFKVRIPSTS